MLNLPASANRSMNTCGIVSAGGTSGVVTGGETAQPVMNDAIAAAANRR
jgi:hypothetical protein